MLFSGYALGSRMNGPVRLAGWPGGRSSGRCGRGLCGFGTWRRETAARLPASRVPLNRALATGALFWWRVRQRRPDACSISSAKCAANVSRP